MWDVTGKPEYKDHAEKWFKLLKSRMTLKPTAPTKSGTTGSPPDPGITYPTATPSTGSFEHPNAGYYEIDLTGIVNAYEHGIVFTKTDIQHLIDTALATKRYWTPLAPYSPEIQKRFEAGHKPDDWGGLGGTPWYLMRRAQLNTKENP